MISYRRNLNMTPGEVPLIVYVSQYDEDFQLIFDLYSSNGTISVPSGTTAAIRGTKKDGNVYSAAATVSGNSVTVAGHKQMTAIAGKNIFEITLYNNGQELSSANFILCVEPSAMDVDKIPSDSSIRELADVISRADEIVGSAAEIAQIAEDLSTEYQNTKNMIATVEDTATSSKSYNVGDFLIYNDKLYQVTRSISSGDTITIGTNVLETIVGEELYSLHKLKASVIISHAEGNIVELDDGADDMPIKSLISTIEPVQDFHGYDKPWVGGAGKNLFDVVEIDRLHKGVTFVNETDSAGNCIGVKLTGAYSNETATATLGHVVLSSGSYIVSGGAENVMLSICPGSSSASQIGQVTTNEVSITLTAETDIYLVVRVTGTFTSGLVIKPMIRLASIIDPAYEPYENICTITGWTGLKTIVAGKNILLPTAPTIVDLNGQGTTRYAQVFGSGTYTIINPTNSGDTDLYYRLPTKDLSNRGSSVTVATGTSRTVTVDENHLLWVFKANNMDMSKFCVNVGTDTEYHEYAGTTTTISWETEAGTVYSGTVDPIKGTLTVDRALKVLDGTSNVSDYQTFAGAVGYNSSSPQFPNADYSKPILCNKLVTIGPSVSQRFGACKYANVSFYFWFQNEAFTSHEDAKAKVAAANIQCLYYLATPIVYTLTPTEIRSLLGENHVWVDTGGIKSLVYCVDTASIIERIDADLAALDGRVDTAQSDITSLETAVEQLDTDIEAVDAKTDKKAPAIYSTASGETASFADGAENVPMTSVIATITPKQDLHGYDYPWVGGAGKNLLNQDGVNTDNGYRNRKYINISGGESNSDEGVWDILEYTPVKPLTTYTISGQTANNANGFAFYDNNKQFLSAIVVNTSPYTFTTPADCYYIRCNRRTTTDSAMQIEAGSSATTYEPYENICPISGHTGASVTRCGKNLLNPNITWTTGIRDDNGNIISGGSHFTNAVYGIKPNTKYTISGTLQIVTVNAHRIYFLKADGTWISRTETSTQSPHTFTTPSECGAIQIQVIDAITELSDVQLEEGSTATSFEPYSGNTFSVSWETEAGTVYSGTVDPIKGTLTVDGAFWRTTWGSGANSGTATDIRRRAFYPTVNADLSSRTLGKCSVAPTVRALDTIGAYFIYATQFYVTLPVNTPDSTQIELFYKLATPIVYTITPMEIRSLLGENHVTVDAGSIECLVYCVDTALFIENEYSEIGERISTVEGITATIETGRASKAYAVGSYLILNDTLYEVISPIASGATITIGTNVAKTTVGAELASIANRTGTLEDEVDAAQDNIVELETAVGTKAPVIYSMVSGDIASFADGADNVPMKSVVATITPKQDLHGYANPWVGGAGKNLLPTVESNTINGVTFAVDGEGVVTATGTADGYAVALTGKITLQANTQYVLSGCPTGGGLSTYRIDFRNPDTPTTALDSELASVFDLGDGATFTPTTTHEVVLGIRVAPNYTFPSGGLKFYPMIRLASVTDSAYEPYENICPIEGYTGMRTTVTGKNFWKLGGDIDSLWFDNMAVGATGKLVTSAANCRANVVKVIGGEQFVISGFDFTQFSANSVLRVFVTKDYPGSNVDAYRLANVTANGQTITIPSGYNWLVCLTFVNTGVTLDMPAQLEYGTTPTDYEEYAGSTTTVSWQTEAGTVYSGAVDVVSGKMVVTHLYKQYTGQASEAWLYSTWTKEATYAFYSTDPLANVQLDNYMCIKYCNPFSLKDYQTLHDVDEPGIAISGSGASYPSVRIPKSLISEGTSEAFRAYLATKPLEIVYELLNPIVHQLSPQQIKTLYAQNHVWTDVGEVSLSYPTDTKLYVDNLFASIPTASGVSF